MGALPELTETLGNAPVHKGFKDIYRGFNEGFSQPAVDHDQPAGRR